MITTEPALAEAEPILQLPGIVATKTALTVFDSATDEQLLRAFGQLGKMEKSVAWWIGDLGIALRERKRRELAVEATELRARANECSDDADGIKAARELRGRADKLESKEVEYTTDLCRIANIDRGYFHNCVSLCQSFSVSVRNETLTPKHHIVILKGIGGTAALKNKANRETAEKWLAEAEENNWRASELRARLAKSHATANPLSAPSEVSQFPELDSADEWARHHLHDEIDSRAAPHMATRWQALINYLHNVVRAAGKAEVVLDS